MTERASPNLRDVAAACGVSHVTVSRVLRGQSCVAPATREKVLRAVDKLGYRNNPLVQAYTSQIRRGKGEVASCNIAWLRSVLDPSLGFHHWQEPYLQGAKQRAQELGFAFDASINAHELDDTQLVRILEARGIRGVIIPSIDYFYRDRLTSDQFAFVDLGAIPGEKPNHCVAPDYFKAVTASFDQLLLAGYQRIGYCASAFFSVITQGQALGSYLFNQQRLSPENRLPPLSNIYRDEADEVRSQKLFLQWIERHRPDVILVPFRNAHNWLTEAGIRVPQDVGIAHLSLTEDVADWSGMDVCADQVGSAAIDLLSAHLIRNEYGPPAEPKRMYITGRWRWGKTTRHPKEDAVAPPSPTQNYSMIWFDEEFPHEGDPAQQF